MTIVRPGAFNGTDAGTGDEPPPFGQVLIIGAGLVGTSLGLALRRRGVAVGFEDADPRHLKVAVSIGAGHVGAAGDRPDLVVVAVPPTVVGPVVAAALDRFPDATVTDVGSVKVMALAGVKAHATGPHATGTHATGTHENGGIERYVGGHPMAGSEQSGPLAARADLFDGRAWAVTPHADSRPDSIAAVELLAAACRAVPIGLTPAEHDEAVALVSHLPQVASSVVAGLLTTAGDVQLNLAGQGLRDVTRIAAGDPNLWTQILSANAVPVANLLREAAHRMEQFAAALDDLKGVHDTELAGADTAALHRSLASGVSGVRRLPGKHGTRPEDFALVSVLLADRPGELAHLFADVEAAGVNIEDVRIDHSPATPAGLVELAVNQRARTELLDVLTKRGWSVHGS